MAHFNLGSLNGNGPEPSLTIDQLAQRTGVTVRNIRAHQSRGLLDPPEVRGRTGYYGRAHVERLELIRRLQADGYSLDLIGRMIVSAGDQSAEALRFTEVLRQPWADEEPRVVDGAELAKRYGSDDPELLAKAEELGLVRPLGKGRWEEMSPRLGRAGAELTDLGIPAKEALRVVARVRRNAESAARTFVHLFVEEVWKPFQRDGSPEERWPEVLDALERLRPMASDSLMAVFLMAMDEEVEQALGRELKRARRDVDEAQTGTALRNSRYPDLLTLRPAGFSFATGRLPTEESRAMARGDVRIAATLECQECKRRNYQTQKSKRNNPDRIELRKYCRWCGKHTPHKETR